MRFPVLVTLLVVLLIQPAGAGFSQTPAKLAGQWRVKFSMSGLNKNAIFEAKENGAGSFTFQDTGPDDKAPAAPAPAAWSQLTDGRVSFSGETELPIGACCREVGTLIFKGRFSSNDTISGKLIFVTSVDDDESPFKFRSEIGAFHADRIPSGRAE